MCEEYEGIASQALATPANTEQLMELKHAIKKVRETTIFELEERIIKAKKRLEFLVSATILPIPPESRVMVQSDPTLAQPQSNVAIFRA